MWFDIIKMNDAEIQELLDDLKQVPNADASALRNEIEEARAELSQEPMDEQPIDPLASREFVSTETPINEFLDDLKPIVEDNEITPEEAQDLKNKEEWQEIVRRNKYPALINLVNSTKQSRIRQV